MFNNKRRKGETEIINKIMEEMIEETGKIEATGGMDELEERIEALENPPKFKREIQFHTSQVDKSTGEIISQNKDITTKCYRSMIYVILIKTM